MSNLLSVRVWSTAAVALLCAAPGSGAAQGTVTVAPIPRDRPTWPRSTG